MSPRLVDSVATGLTASEGRMAATANMAMVDLERVDGNREFGTGAQA